ncbi:hypothetical protein Bbelb_027460 [Branchiostoma belcheri]|nr:hypothetical protein Bbelb_027460 [Branchiostoma belcheri]
MRPYGAVLPSCQLRLTTDHQGYGISAEKGLTLVQPVQNTDAGPALQNTDASPALQNTDAGPALQNTDASPALQNTDASPALQNTDASPALQNTDAGPALQNTDASPALQNTDAGPALQNTDASPALQNTDAGPALQNTDAGPALQNTDAGPALQNTDASPALQNTDAGPALCYSSSEDGSREMDKSNFLNDDSSQAHLAPFVDTPSPEVSTGNVETLDGSTCFVNDRVFLYEVGMDTTKVDRPHPEEAHYIHDYNCTRLEPLMEKEQGCQQRPSNSQHLMESGEEN